MVAPNEEWARVLGERTGKRTFVMSRGVDTTMFDPAKRHRTDSTINIRYVGRLSPEKSVRVLADVERALLAKGVSISGSPSSARAVSAHGWRVTCGMRLSQVSCAE